jgi:hypothetical protein
MGGHGMQGMVDDATMAKLKSLKGPEFDTLWLQAMIGHHQGAIDMAKAEIAKGQSADMTAMAKTMVTAQQAEINDAALPTGLPEDEAITNWRSSPQVHPGTRNLAGAPDLVK